MNLLYNFTNDILGLVWPNKKEELVDETKIILNLDDSDISMNKRSSQTLANNNLDQTLANNNLDQTLVNNNLDQTLANNNLDQTLANNNLDQTLVNNNLDQTSTKTSKFNINLPISCPKCEEMCKTSDVINIIDKKIICSICLKDSIKEHFLHIFPCGHVICDTCLNDGDDESNINTYDDLSIYDVRNPNRPIEWHLHPVDVKPVKNQKVDEFFLNYHNNGGKEKVHVREYAGMGCINYIRRMKGKESQQFFMHSDNWGQYGEDTNDQPQLQHFLKGYRFIGQINSSN